MEQNPPTEKQTSQPPMPKLLSCGEIVQNLADVFRVNLTAGAMSAYVLTVGHRSSEDLNKAYRQILRDARFMPTPGDLLDACGILKESRS